MEVIRKDEGNNFVRISKACIILKENQISNRSSWKERKENALASGAEEGRDKLR